MQKIIITGLLFTTIKAHTNDNISYNYLEIGYGHLDQSQVLSPDGIYVEGSFGLSERFYLGGHLDYRDDLNIDFKRYDLTLGFHTLGQNKTDFYAEIRGGNLEFGNIEGTTIGLFAGTRTAFTERFELITKIGFSNIEGIEHPDGDNLIIYEADVKGIFNITKKQAITTSIESYDGDFGFKLGYRVNF